VRRGPAGCGDDDAGSGAEAASSAATDTEAPAEDTTSDGTASDVAAGGSGSATVGATVYAFVPGERTFCRIAESAGALSVSGLVDQATGAELTVDYSADSEATALVSIQVEGGPHLESSSVVVDGPPQFAIDSEATGGGQFIDLDDPASEPVTGQVVVSCS
jgi:hypothetical protein